MSHSLATRTQQTISFVVPSPGSEVVLFISISRETTERECWWVWGGEETCVGDEEGGAYVPRRYEL